MIDEIFPRFIIILLNRSDTGSGRGFILDSRGMFMSSLSSRKSFSDDTKKEESLRDSLKNKFRESSISKSLVSSKD